MQLRADKDLWDIADKFNQQIQGWITVVGIIIGFSIFSGSFKPSDGRAASEASGDRRQAGADGIAALSNQNLLKYQEKDFWQFVAARSLFVLY